MSINSLSLTNVFNRQRILLIAGFALLMVAYHYIYGQFFPNRNGLMGHDWNISGWLVTIQNYRDQGLSLWSVSSNPTACQGKASMGLGFPVALSSFLAYCEVDPLLGIYIDCLSFAVLGFWGMYLLLRNSFRLEMVVAFLGASLFLFNEFYAARIIIGHPFYAVMLLPLVMYFLTRTPKGSLNWRSDIAHGAVAGIILFYGWMNGLLYVVATFLLSMVLISLLAMISGGSLRSLLQRSMVALFVALGWSWWVLSQTLFAESLSIAIAERQAYSLQGFVSLWQTLKMVVLVLFYGPQNIADIYSAVITNLSIYQGQHELEYGIGPAALLILIVAAGYGIAQWLNRPVFFEGAWWRKNAVWLLIMLAALLFPVLYTTYAPLTTPLWKKLPLLNSTTSPQRIYFVYIVFFSVLTAQWLQKYLPAKTYFPVAIAAIFLTLGATVVKDRSFYHNQPYDPKPVEEGYQLLKKGGALPPIERISLLANEKGQAIHNQMEEANAFLKGAQPMGCYVPAYSSQPVELIKSLHPGSVWAEKDGVFNIKNPACNSWPKENDCLPGDHFKVSQRDWVEKFTHYQPFPVVVPDKQIFANWISIISVVLTIGYLLVYAWLYLRRKS